MNKNITATILLVLAIGIYFTVTKGILASAKDIQTVNYQYSSAIDSAEQLIKVRDKVLKDYNSLAPTDRDRLDKMLPSTVDNIRLIIDLNSIALKHGFSLRNIKAIASTNSNSNGSNQQSTAQRSNNPVPATANNDANTIIIPVPTLDTVTLSFGVTAPYQQFITFLQDLEANLRVMDITHLTLSSNDSGVYDWNVEMKTYWLRQH